MCHKCGIVILNKLYLKCDYMAVGLSETNELPCLLKGLLNLTRRIANALRDRIRIHPMSSFNFCYCSQVIHDL